MKETVTGGKKEFIYSVLWSVFLLIAGRFIIFALPSYKVIGSLATLLMFCVLGFFVMTRYAAVYTYELTKNTLRVNRRIGNRNKEMEAKLSEIKYIGAKKPKQKTEMFYTMRARVFPGRKICYILYERKKAVYGLAFEPSQDFINKMQSLMKH